MSTIEDLGIKSVTNMTDDELRAHLVQLRTKRTSAPSRKGKGRKASAKAEPTSKLAAAVKTDKGAMAELIAALKADIGEE